MNPRRKLSPRELAECSKLGIDKNRAEAWAQAASMKHNAEVALANQLLEEFPGQTRSWALQEAERIVSKDPSTVSVTLVKEEPRDHAG